MSAAKETSTSAEKFFRPSDLSSYPLRQRMMIRAAGIVFYLLVLAVGKTVRFRVEGSQYKDEVWQTGTKPVLVCWHNQTFLAAYWLRNLKVVALTSKSFDGEYIARFIQRLGFGAVRGSSSRGGVGALVEMVRVMKHGYATSINPDGPRGPRYQTKTGPVLLAKKSGKPILPVAILPESSWRMRSWDRYHIPKPFSRAVVRIGRPIEVRSDADDEELERMRQQLQIALDEINLRGN